MIKLDDYKGTSIEKSFKEHNELQKAWSPQAREAAVLARKYKKGLPSDFSDSGVGKNPEHTTVNLDNDKFHGIVHEKEGKHYWSLLRSGASHNILLTGGQTSSRNEAKMKIHEALTRRGK